MKSSGKKHTAAGFSLIEIIVVLLVAAIVLPALILPFRVAVRELDQPVIFGTLALLAQEEMEKRVISVESFEEVAGWAGEQFPAPFTDYSSQGVVESEVDFPPVQGGLKRVTVTVTHSGGQSLTLVTFKSDWRMESE